jgi:hypothetical protein
VQKTSAILAFVIGLLFAGFGAVNAGIHTCQIRTIEANRQTYGALEDSIANEQTASFKASDDAQGAMDRNDEEARSLAGITQTVHSNNAIAARLTLGAHTSNAEAAKLFEILSKHKADDLNVAVGIALLLLWLSLTLCDADSSMAKSSCYRVTDVVWLRILKLEKTQWERQMDGPSRSQPYQD